MNLIDSIAGFFQNGGPFMYPILIVLALGLAIALERWVFLTRTSLANRMLWKKLTPHLEGGRFALISKVHNCMVEADSGADLFQTMLSGSRDDRMGDPPPFEPRPIPSGLELVRDEVRDDLGVGLGLEDVAVTLQVRAERVVVLDDAVVD